jgi:hypothetical protein
MKGLFYALLLHLCLSPCLPLHWFQRGSVGIPDLRYANADPDPGLLVTEKWKIYR